MPTSVLLQEGVWSSSPGGLPRGAPFQDTDLGKSQGLSAWLPLPGSAVFQRRVKPTALSSTESGQLCVHMEVLITPGDSCSRSQGKQVVGDRC